MYSPNKNFLTKQLFITSLIGGTIGYLTFRLGSHLSTEYFFLLTSIVVIVVWIVAWLVARKFIHTLKHDESSKKIQVMWEAISARIGLTAIVSYIILKPLGIIDKLPPLETLDWLMILSFLMVFSMHIAITYYHNNPHKLP